MLINLRRHTEDPSFTASGLRYCWHGTTAAMGMYCQVAWDGEKENHGAVWSSRPLPALKIPLSFHINKYLLTQALSRESEQLSYKIKESELALIQLWLCQVLCSGTQVFWITWMCQALFLTLGLCSIYEVLASKILDSSRKDIISKGEESIR